MVLINRDFTHEQNTDCLDTTELPGSQIVNCSFSYIELRDLWLEKLNVCITDFKFSSLCSVDFSNSVFEGCDFSYTTFDKCLFSKAIFIGCIFDKTTFCSCLLDEAVFTGCSFNKPDVSNSTLNATKFKACRFFQGCFQGIISGKAVFDSVLFDSISIDDSVYIDFATLENCAILNSQVSTVGIKYICYVNTSITASIVDNAYKGEIIMTTPNTPNMGNQLSEDVFETGGVWSNQDAEEDTEVEVDLSDGEEFDLPTEEEVDPKSRIEL